MGRAYLLIACLVPGFPCGIRRTVTVSVSMSMPAASKHGRKPMAVVSAMTTTMAVSKMRRMLGTVHLLSLQHLGQFMILRLLHLLPFIGSGDGNTAASGLLR